MTTLCPSCGANNIEGADQCANCGADLRMTDLPKPASQIERSVMHEPLTALKMTRVHELEPDTSLDAAVQTLIRQDVDIVEIVEAGRLIGVLSVRDLITRIGPDYAGKMNEPVRAYMTKSAETLAPDAPITHAINKMNVGGYRHVPVAQDGRMVGVVSAGDVIAYLVKHSRENIAGVGATTSHGVQPTV